MQNVTDSTRVYIYTFKEGFLSAIAHDLKIEATGFELMSDGSNYSARFDPSALTIVCAMKKGKENLSALSDKDKKDIGENLKRDVLNTDRFPVIEFKSENVVGNAINGTLSMHGVSKLISLEFQQDGGERVAEFDLDQRDFGIKPFRAKAGTLKVNPTQKIQIRTTLDA